MSFLTIRHPGGCPERSPMERMDSEIERYAVCCWFCASATWFDWEESLPDMTTCWRCGEIINPEL